MWVVENGVWTMVTPGLRICWDKPVEMINWLSLSLRWLIAYIVATSSNPKPQDTELNRDSVYHIYRDISHSSNNTTVQEIPLPDVWLLVRIRSGPLSTNQMVPSTKAKFPKLNVNEGTTSPLDRCCDRWYLPVALEASMILLCWLCCRTQRNCAPKNATSPPNMHWVATESKQTLSFNYEWNDFDEIYQLQRGRMGGDATERVGIEAKEGR